MFLSLKTISNSLLMLPSNQQKKPTKQKLQQQVQTSKIYIYSLKKALEQIKPVLENVSLPNYFSEVTYKRLFDL